MEQVFDVAIIGGGINGCGISADAAMRGLSVILIEKDDLASKTSSASSKLIHGGLRYLEYCHFSLVKKALGERQNLLNLACHLVHPIPFIMPYQQQLRPKWLLRAGLFVYDKLNRNNQLPNSKSIYRVTHPSYFSPLANSLHEGFLFYDCITDDSRLTISNALQARKHGATIWRDSELLAANTQNAIWHLTVQRKKKEIKTVKAKTAINATGPWVESIDKLLAITSPLKMTLVKGSHLVVRKLYEGKHAYLLQHSDKRIVFTIPYHEFTLIGTTDVAFSGNLNEVIISNDEITYLTDLVEHYFNCQLTEQNIIASWSGIRPLLASPSQSISALNRDYSYNYTSVPAPAITIHGGKITTYRQLASQIVNKLAPFFPTMPYSKTDISPLPGSEANYDEYVLFAHKQYHWLDEKIRARYLANYGTRTELFLAHCQNMADLGHHFGNGLYQVEIDYLVQEEWAIDCEDILWRRTKLGLHFNSMDTKTLAAYLKEKSA